MGRLRIPWWKTKTTKMVLSVLLVVAVVAGFTYAKLRHRVVWITPLNVSASYLQGKMNNTASDYLGVFEYTIKIPAEVREVTNTCRSKTMDICYRSKDYYLYQDTSRVRFHLQNRCEYTAHDVRDEYFMKITATCPIVDHNQLLRGYILYASMLNVNQTDVIVQLRSIASEIGSTL